MKISLDRAQKIIGNYSSANVLVLGDLMLDVFIWGDVRRISPEAPVPVVEVDRESSMPGGSANVVNNICAMGGKCSVSGIIGDDLTGTRLIEELKQEKADIKGIIVDNERDTTQKTRIIARQQQVVRFDREAKHRINDLVFDKIKQYLDSVIDTLDAVIIEDYGKGFIFQELLDYITTLCKDKNVIVTFDPKMGNNLNCTGISAVTPNKEEACYFAGILPEEASKEHIVSIGDTLLKKWGVQAILITMGKDGMCLFEKGAEPFSIPTVAREVFDVSGAGDTVIGAFTLSLASGATFREAAILANYAAGVVVGKLGTGVVTAEELSKAIESEL